MVVQKSLRTHTRKGWKNEKTANKRIYPSGAGEVGESGEFNTSRENRAYSAHFNHIIHKCGLPRYTQRKASRSGQLPQEQPGELSAMETPSLEVAWSGESSPQATCTVLVTTAACSHDHFFLWSFPHDMMEANPFIRLNPHSLVAVELPKERGMLKATVCWIIFSDGPREALLDVTCASLGYNVITNLKALGW